MLAELESLPVATPPELLELIERRDLHGSKATFVWTLDKRLEAVASGLGCAYRPSLPP